MFYLRLKALAAGAGKLASVVRGDARFAPTAVGWIKKQERSIQEESGIRESDAGVGAAS